MNYVQQVMNPAWYHGHGKNAPYFEGWYFKLINEAEDQRWAIIPGIFKNADATESHAFIQVLDGITGQAAYYRFPIDTFRAQPDAFNVRIGRNHFQLQSLALDIKDSQLSIVGELHFGEQEGWPVNWFNSGVMGPLGWLSFLECYHGILSFDHEIRGNLCINGQPIDFTGGRGYIEKDWGRSFPLAYIWQQTNHFPTAKTCLTGAVAIVPNIGRPFKGVAVGFWQDGTLYPFTTYNGTLIDRVSVTDTDVQWVLYNRDYELRVHSERAKGGLLLGPEREAMHKRVDETLQALAHVELYELLGRQRRLIYRGTGRNAGLEVVGNMEKLIV